MKITFCGAARMVTGSCYLIEADNKKILVDCGLFQGRKEINKLNYLPFRFDPKEISHVLLTHAHLDHSGLIPKLRAAGFKGKVLATSVTVDLCRIMFEDSAHIMLMETEHENKRRAREGLLPRKPIYTLADAKSSFPLFRKVDYNKRYKISENIKAVFRDAGHIIGSSIIELFIENKKLVFSGDLGQWNVPIIKDPTIIDEADYLFLESTYGNRLHEGIGLRDSLLLKHAKKTFAKGGRLLIPSFAIERTQELLYSLNKLVKSGKFPKQKIFLDSPLAIKATEIFKDHREFFDKEALRFKNRFTVPDLLYCNKTSDSIKLNHYKKPCVIIAGSGMCTGGRIRHHFKHGLWDSRNTVLFIGFQAEGTLGRVILEGAKRVRMMGIEIAVKADVEKIDSFSAHADYKEILKWTAGFKKRPKKIFIMHGEETASKSLKLKLEKKGFKCHIPRIGEMKTL